MSLSPSTPPSATRTARFENNAYNHLAAVPPGDTHAVVADALFVAVGTATSLSDALGYRLARNLPVVDSDVRIARDSGRGFYGNPLPATPRRKHRRLRAPPHER
jgi:hypothetical protein